MPLCIQKERLNSYSSNRYRIKTFLCVASIYTREFRINNNPDYELVDIFADEGITGTNTKKREGFQRLIQACDDGKVDLVITKSISRFARNTADCLHYSRHLKSLGIPIKFEKEGINTMDSSGELLFTILSSLAQEESRNISENTQWGIRSKFQKGIPHLNTDCFLGYDEMLKLIFRFEELNESDLVNAANLCWDDFEDAIQCVTAERIKADCIITRNIRDFKRSRITAFTPTEYLARQ